MWEWFGRGMGFPSQKQSRHFQLKDENKQGNVNGGRTIFIFYVFLIFCNLYGKNELFS